MKARQFKFNGLMVRMLREQMKLRPRDLAQITGLTVRAIYNIEHGRSPNPRLATMAALAQALHIPVGQLIFEVPQK